MNTRVITFSRSNTGKITGVSIAGAKFSKSYEDSSYSIINIGFLKSKFKLPKSISLIEKDSKAYWKSDSSGIIIIPEKYFNFSKIPVDFSKPPILKGTFSR